MEVGEQGPEVAYMPTGTTIAPNGGGLTGDLHVHVDVNGHELGTAVLKDFRQRAARA